MSISPDILLSDVHTRLKTPAETSVLVSGKYAYYHYCCDGVDDRGWGCGYRTLQTICSWIYYNMKKTESVKKEVPTISSIQKALVTMNDKSESFMSSKEWIGSFEICLCLDYFYDVPCKLHHLRSGDDLFEGLQILFKHFTEFGSPVMMGGDTDTASKCILGISGNSSIDCSLLILDPHCCTEQCTIDVLMTEKWISWRHVSSFEQASFYNLCLPQMKSCGV